MCLDSTEGHRKNRIRHRVAKNLLVRPLPTPPSACGRRGRRQRMKSAELLRRSRKEGSFPRIIKVGHKTPPRQLVGGREGPKMKSFRNILKFTQTIPKDLPKVNEFKKLPMTIYRIYFRIFLLLRRRVKITYQNVK